jgi:hypothetical protein
MIQGSLRVLDGRSGNKKGGETAPQQGVNLRVETVLLLIECIIARLATELYKNCTNISSVAGGSEVGR